jgi:hypothetical protein
LPSLSGKSLDSALARRNAIAEEIVKLSNEQSKNYNVWAMERIQECLKKGKTGVGYFVNGEINVQRMATVGDLLSTSTIVGNYVGTQSSILLSRISPLLSKIGGGVIGGGVASILIAGGLYATGNADVKTAIKMGASGVAVSGITSATFAAPQIAMFYATTYGVTSSGVAIASLHGAAQTS